MANHKESYALMWYECSCGARLRAWNSRDGVTPFGINCSSCGGIMRHVDWNKDDKAYGHKPFPGQVVFRDLTRLDAEEIAHQQLRARGIDPMTHERLEELIDSIHGDGKQPKVTYFRPDHPENKLKELERHSFLYKGLRRLMGYVENGSSTSVKLSQDDATRDFFVTVGSDVPRVRRQAPYWFGSSLDQALEKAIKDNPEDE